jgi:hypothetical protein
MLPAGTVRPVLSAPPGAYRLDDGRSRRIMTFTLVLAGLLLLDILTTQLILRMGGAELNPLMTGIVTMPALHIAIKSALLLLALYVSLTAEVRVRGSGTVLYGMLIALYLVIVCNNIGVILPHVLP